jgi:hypothetical protein
MDDYDEIGGDFGSNTGLGLEMLMNNKVVDNSKRYFNGNNLDDVTNLDNTLNELGGADTYRPQSSLFGEDGDADDMGGMGGIGGGDEPRVNFNEEPSFMPSSSGNIPPPSWNDYNKYDNMPGGGGGGENGRGDGSGGGNGGAEARAIGEKMAILRELETYERNGYKLLKSYSLSDSYAEMSAELNTLKCEEKRIASIGFQKRALLFCMHGLEMLNGWANPIDGFELGGFTKELESQLNEKEYEIVFAELYEKYKDQISMWPELKLMFMLGGGVASHVIRQNMRKTLFAAMGASREQHAMNQYPDATRLMEQSMLNSMMGDAGAGATPFMQAQQQQQQYAAHNQSAPSPSQYLPNSGGGPPPPTIRTRGINPAPMAQSAGATRGVNNGPPGHTQMRPEMAGPRDINSLFSGIKTRTLNIPVVSPTDRDRDRKMGGDGDNESVVTMDELKSNGGDVNLPRTKSRSKKGNNSINL